MRQRGFSGHPERKDPYRLLRSKGAFGGVSFSFAGRAPDRAKRAWQEAAGGGEGVPKGVRVGAVLCHVVVAAASGLGLFFRVGGAAPRAEPGSASTAWRLLAAWGLLSCLPVQVRQPALRRLGAAGEGGQPALTPGPAAKGTCQRAEGGRGRQSLANGVQRLLQETGRRRRNTVPSGPSFCVCIRLG